MREIRIVVCKTGAENSGWLDKIPVKPGVYILLLKVSSPLSVVLKKREIRLEPGYYAYVGSARGWGGLRARISRHARKKKKIWWHIDRITSSENAEIVTVYCGVGGLPRIAESFLAQCLASKGLGYVEGFGSTDDRLSASHLFFAKLFEKLEEASKECIEELRYLDNAFK